jgi:Tfp pilus assembly protein PilF
MVDEDRRQRAIEVWQEAYNRQMKGDFAEAIRLYQESIAIFPTAEAHTFLGWTYSFQGRLDEAIQECHKAIAVDPDFGNPYNDIGVYLMQKGDLDGAIPWLETAKRAPRYEPRQFPYMNLGRIYLRRGQWSEALRELEGGVRVAPDDPEIRKMLHELRAKFN